MTKKRLYLIVGFIATIVLSLLYIAYEADPKGQPLAFIRIVSECDDRYCRGRRSHYSLQIIPTFPVCCSMTTCRCRAPSRYPYQLVDTHTHPPIILPP